MSELHELSATTIAERIADGSLRAADVTDAFLRRIETHDPQLHCFLEYFADRARQRAEAIDRDRQAGRQPGPLGGVPVALKDNLLLAEHVASCSSRILEGFRAPYSATVVERLEQQGAVLLGRTNMDEFGMGSSTEHSAFGPTHNPWALDRVPGGSSGGSAAAVAAGLCPLALGSDTGGSVRQPAAMCGIAGLKPTYGLLSRRGLVAYASSLDCVGVLARSCEDLALSLSVAGRDPGDATSRDRPTDVTRNTADGTDLSNLRIGLPRQCLDAGIDTAVKAVVDDALGVLQQLGAQLVPIELPHLEHAVSAYYLIAAAEASSNLARYDGVRFGRGAQSSSLEALYTNSRSAGFGGEVQLRILLGTFALQHGYHDEMYGQATRCRQLLRGDFRRAFESCDVIASPTSPVPAFALGSRTADPVAMYLCDALTVPTSLAGLPGLSLPCGFAHEASADGDATAQIQLPVGLQLTAPAWQELTLLQIGERFEQQTQWHQQRPELRQ